MKDQRAAANIDCPNTRSQNGHDPTPIDFDHEIGEVAQMAVTVRSGVAAGPAGVVVIAGCTERGTVGGISAIAVFVYVGSMQARLETSEIGYYQHAVFCVGERDCADRPVAMYGKEPDDCRFRSGRRARQRRHGRCIEGRQYGVRDQPNAQIHLPAAAMRFFPDFS
jgi:hypothetical protein